MLVIKKIIVHQLQLKLKVPFKTAHNTTKHRPITLIEMEFTNGLSGIGEVASFNDNDYATETQMISLAEIRKIAPVLIGQKITTPEIFANLMATLSSWSFTTAAFEMAVWDAWGKSKQQSLAMLIGATKTQVSVGIALGLPATQATFEQQIYQAVLAGYSRIKIKINATTSMAMLKQVIAKYPAIKFSVDANASWQLKDVAKIGELEQAGIYLLEQPFIADAWQAHTQIQQMYPNLKISLDESLNGIDDVKYALTKTKVKALTIKQAKIGGISNALWAIKTTQKEQRLAWIGGMLSSGVGRAVDLALAAMPGADTFPSDSSASDRYFEQDIVNEQPRIMAGKLPVPIKPGLGVTINWEIVASLATKPVIIYQ